MRWLGIACVVIASFVAGCNDPVRTTVHLVRFVVTSAISAQPVTDAEVSLRYDYDRNVPPGESRPQAERPDYERFSGKTDARGQADIPVQWTVLDRSLGPTPPPGEIRLQTRATSSVS